MTAPWRSIVAKSSFEESLAKLESIVEAIESGKVGLEESVKQFEEGMRLIQNCRRILADAELKIQKLQTNSQGELEAGGSFAVPDADDSAGAAGRS